MLKFLEMYCPLVVFLLLAVASGQVSHNDGAKLIFAVNAGGEAHIDVHGIHYQRDFLKIGISSDYGKHLSAVGRVHAHDHILYQTERYHFSTFGYDIPIDQDGEYVMVLKFCEVYFNAPNMKVFDVVLNGDHTIISDLDIHDRVGHGVAYDEIVPFTVTHGQKTLIYKGVESELRGGQVRIEFIKGYRDNPKINAIYVVKGTVADVPQLPAIPYREDEEEQVASEPEESAKASRNRKPSGPKMPDPYEEMAVVSAIFPVFVAVGAFIPVLVCLCKL